MTNREFNTHDQAILRAIRAATTAEARRFWSAQRVALRRAHSRGAPYTTPEVGDTYATSQRPRLEGNRPQRVVHNGLVNGGQHINRN